VPHDAVDIDVDFEPVEEDVVIGTQAEQVRQLVRTVVGRSETTYVSGLAVRSALVLQACLADLAGVAVQLLDPRGDRGVANKL
jgi:hypothetical protein